MSSDILKSLEDMFGKLPHLLRENVKYLEYNDTNEEFKCIPCGRTVQVNNNNGSPAINLQHLFSKTHRKMAVSVDALKIHLTEIFSGKIPQIVLNNIFVLGMDEEYYTCIICDKKITVSKYSSVTETNFSYHLLSSSHEENLEEYRETMGHVQGIYGGIPDNIRSNSQFLRLTRTGKNYVCTICNVLLKVSETNDNDETKEVFENHFHLPTHIRNAKQAKAFTKLPKLKQVFPYLPNYMLRNLEYFSINEEDIFCSLCNENIKFSQSDPYETEQNFKLHNLSSFHEENLFNRRDSKNEVFNRLHDVFEDISESVMENLKYLIMSENELFCSICEEFLLVEEDNDDTQYCITYHFESDYHESNVSEEIQRCLDLTNDLTDLFGNIPPIIQENIKHLEFVGKNNFWCVLCNATLQSKIHSDDRDYIADITEENFEKHLTGNQHKLELENINSVNESLQIHMEDLFGSIPQFIINNWDHIGYKNDSDDFFCVLCDQSISVVHGSKMEDLTFLNLRSHFLSFAHINKLKHKARRQVEVTEKLESIFGKIPNFILSNVDHIHKDNDDGSFFCNTCDAQLVVSSCLKTTERNFYQHLRGSRHKGNVKEIESCNDSAFNQLDTIFWRLPEFLLRNIDYLLTSGDDLFCQLCQRTLYIYDDDLNETKQQLKSHFDSSWHQYNLINV